MNEMTEIASTKVNLETSRRGAQPRSGAAEPPKGGTTYLGESGVPVCCPAFRRFPVAPLANTAIIGLIVALASGCTYLAPKRAKVGERLQGEARALTTAVVETLEAQPRTNRDVYTEVALTFAKQDQRVLGIPEKPFDVASLLIGMGASNVMTPLGAPTDKEVQEEPRIVRERFADENRWMAVRSKLEGELIARGAVAEEKRNERIARWTKFSVGTVTLLGGLVALFVFCPVAIPICGRLLAWLVSKAPSLASAVGVVSVNAFDSVVRGIENAKNEKKNDATADSADDADFQKDKNGRTPTPTTLANSPAAPTVPVANAIPATFPLAPSDGERAGVRGLAVPPGDSRRGQANSPSQSAPSAKSAVQIPWVERLEGALSREMDAAHKALVRARKTNLS